jgi:CheY-like chemotaxis protein
MCHSTQVSQLFRRKILHVDHYPANIELVQGVIDLNQDLQLITATTGAQCIELASKHLPAVILTESVLCDMNSTQLMEKLRTADATSSIPVIAVSSYALPGQIAAAMDAGVYRYLTKPFKIQDLFQAIDDALQYAAQRREALAA